MASSLFPRRRQQQPGKFAFVTFLCNGSDHLGFGWADQLLRAHRLGLSLKGSTIDRLAITYNYRADVTDMTPLTSAGWRVINASHVPRESFALKPIRGEEKHFHWPRSGYYTRVQRRPDVSAPTHTKSVATTRASALPADPAPFRACTLSRLHPTPASAAQFNCTSLKLLAWNLTMYERVMVSDTDVCLESDPLPWMVRHRREYFVATPQRADRPYLGISSHFMFLQPDAFAFRLLVDMGTTRSFIPYTNSEQDIIETVFATHRSFPPLPNHRHDHNQPRCPLPTVASIRGDSRPVAIIGVDNKWGRRGNRSQPDTRPSNPGQLVPKRLEELRRGGSWATRALLGSA